MPVTDRSLARIQSVAIVCFALLASITPYAVLFSRTVNIQVFTSIFTYFISMVILPFLCIIGIVCAFLLVERRSWQTFAIVL
jgi:hypothetical protein